MVLPYATGVTWLAELQFPPTRHPRHRCGSPGCERGAAACRSRLSMLSGDTSLGRSRPFRRLEAGTVGAAGNHPGALREETSRLRCRAQFLLPNATFGSPWPSPYGSIRLSTQVTAREAQPTVYPSGKKSLDRSNGNYPRCG